VSKSRFCAGAVSLLFAASIVVFPAVRGYGAPTNVGQCVGQVGLLTFATGLADTTTTGVTAKGSLLKNLDGQRLGGTCVASVRPGDPIHPAGGSLLLTPKAVTVKLLGNVSCAWGAGLAADTNAAASWPANGTITWTMNELNDLGKPYKIQARITVTPNAAVGAELFDVSGMVTAGPGVGAKVTGTVWSDPAFRNGVPGGPYNIGYAFADSNTQLCGDNIPGNSSITETVFGGGGPSTVPLTGATSSYATGFQFVMP
jgi:hypothetical protein